jgi:hypothetical protein
VESQSDVKDESINQADQAEHSHHPSSEVDRAQDGLVPNYECKR